MLTASVRTRLIMQIKTILARSIAGALAFLLPPRLMRNKKFFHLWESRGYHVTPVHFYEPIPDTQTLRDDLWTTPFHLDGVELNEGGQLEILSLFASTYAGEYNAFSQLESSSSSEYLLINPFFGSVDAEILYCMIRHFKPRRIIEVGSGYSSRVAAKAILKNREENQRGECSLTAIEPFPDATLRRGFPGLSKLVTKRVQDIPLSEFTSLAENDILFLDSSHVLAVGSDVQYEYLTILPKLNPGVLIHVHDVFLPMEYPRTWVLGMHRFWHEQYLLHAFLMHNHRFEILWSGYYMHLTYPSRLASAFSSYTKRRQEDWPVSFWIRRRE